MTAPLKALETAVGAMLAQAQALTPAVVREWIDRFRTLPDLAVSDEEAEALARVMEARHAVTMTLGSVLRGGEFRPWLDAAKVDIEFYYWERYQKLLIDKGRSRGVMEALHLDTERSLGLLQNPIAPGPWGRKGMVVGQVQSGKTANYIGLICKAADAGYRVIVVIAGIHNNLRNQTQQRIDEGFVGRDSARLLSRREDKFVGVGKVDARRRPITFTNSLKDFSKALASGVGVPLHSLTEPAVFVIKKNATTLRNLTEWLSEHSATARAGTIDVPMLLIDDEADNASINTGYGREEVTRINSQIRGLLQLFSRSSYVAYTATPFANIFIDPDTDDEMLGQDLFPRHFIVSLDPPSNYFGPQEVFGSQAGSVIRRIDDNEDLLPLKHPISHELAGIPPSMLKAIRAFVIGVGIRLIRRQVGRHHSMLINASRFTGVQQRLASCVRDRLETVQRSLSVNGGLPADQADGDPEIAALRELFESDFSATDTSWLELLPRLHEAAAPIRIIEVNSASTDPLDYNSYSDTGLRVIAIGGYSLSRGLTLEDLMISYFLRNSVMYDTLMQMGRWFGYRDGFEDLCRLWLMEEAEEWYTSITEYIDELRAEFRQMAAAGGTPEDFGLRVRSHPGSLIVTARNKMGSGEKVVVALGLANQFVETATLRSQADGAGPLEQNRQALNQFCQALADSGKVLTGADKVSGGRLLKDVEVALVKQFIRTFTHHPLSLLTDPAPVCRYIQQRESTELQLWDVFFPSPVRREATLPDVSVHGVTLALQMRSQGSKSTPDTLRITNKQRVASRGIEKVGLTDADVAKAEAGYRALRENGKGGTAKLNYPDWIYRQVRQRPLLIIHQLQINDHRGEPLYRDPVVAWSISFPGTNHPEERVEYVVNSRWLQENFHVEPDEDPPDDR